LTEGTLVDEITARVIKLRRGDMGWVDIAASMPGYSQEAVRSRYRRWRARQEPPTCVTTGVVADEPLDKEEIWQRAVAKWKRAEKLLERKRSQSLVFSHGPVAITWFADLHCGDDDVDYPRMEREIGIVRDTPGMYAGLVGDGVENFILAVFASVRLNASFTIPEEWALFQKVLELLGPKLRIVVSGNHDWWTKKLAGIDYFRQVVAGISPDVLYDTDDCELTIKVGEMEVPTRVRHEWKGSSIYNPSHGIERTAKWDQGFLLGVGAHLHECGVPRKFNAAGRNGLAVMCGSYKRSDSFARRKGFPKQNESTAITVIFDDETNSMTGFDNLEFAARFMRNVYKLEEVPNV